MESEDAGHVPAVELPTSVAQWVTKTADELDVPRQRLLSELLAAHGSLHEEDADDRLDELRDEFMEKLTDVRERVAQIKREADEKAPVDHDHPDLRDELDERRERVDDDGEDITAEVDLLRERVAANRERLDSGFENYEEVLDYLTETTDELDGRLDVLARALVSVRDQVRMLATENATRVATAELARTANRHGIKSAKCGDCEMSVTIALLTEPNCPHCGATFEDIEPKQGFFGSNWLVVGRPPALDGDIIDPDAAIDPEAADLLSGVTEE
jgi:prefoldin subunit 5